ncbi:MAG: hypothetical protein ACI8W7_000928 [Gammaproteobacteria bacterium]|jgi:hypothetical protein
MARKRSNRLEVIHPDCPGIDMGKAAATETDLSKKRRERAGLMFSENATRLTSVRPELSMWLIASVTCMNSSETPPLLVLQTPVSAL